MIVYLYRWKLIPGTESTFREAWSLVTRYLRDHCHSFGSRLHEGNDGLFYGYAQWPDHQTREKAIADSTNVNEARLKMRSCVAQEFPEIVLNPQENYLKLPTAPRLETSRLVLRPHLISDFPDCCSMWADSEVVRYIGGKPSTPQQVWSRILGYAGQWHFMNYGYWAIEEKNTGKFVGEIGFAEFMRDMVPSIKGVPEMGWALSPEFHGIGYGSEAIACALSWGRQNLFQTKIACIISPDNKPSVKLAVKSGFKKECATEYAGQPTDLFFMNAR